MTRDPSSTFIAADGKDMLPAEEVAKACISVLDTAPDVLVINVIDKLCCETKLGHSITYTHELCIALFNL